MADKDKFDEVIDSFMNSDISSEIKDDEDLILEPLLEELDRIESHSIRSFTRAMLLRADRFWQAPSSSSPGFYPPDELLEGGLVLHTKRVFRVVEVICALMGLDSGETDKLKSAALLHDVTKMIYNQELQLDIYDYMHPYTVDALYNVVKRDDELYGNEAQSNSLAIEDESIDHILKAVRSHKGVQSPIPETIPHKDSISFLLHLSNEIAKALHYFIDGEDIVLERWLKTNGEQE